MRKSEKHVELRVAYPGHPHVAVLGSYRLTGGFERIYNRFYSHRERLQDGTQQQVHLLPDHDLTYEVVEVIAGRRVRWYAATLEGDPDIHRISLQGAKAYGRREMSLQDVVREYPEKPPIEVEDY